MSVLSPAWSFIKKYKILLVIALCIILALVFYFRSSKPTPIETQTVKREDIVQSLSETGSIDSETTVNLNFILSGKLVYLGVKQADTVQQGQTIAMLDQHTMQDNLQTALRNYSEQRNSFDQTKDNNQNRTPDQALNDAMKRILQNNQYDLDKAVYSVELQSFAKEQSVLTSPISGIVTRVDAQSTGINISPANIFTVIDPKHLVFKADVDEADIGHIYQGQQIKVTLDPYPDSTLNLSINKIDFVTHTTSTGGDAYTVQATLPQNNDLNYRIGMNGDADIILAEKKDVLAVPLASIVNNSYVYVKNANDFVKRGVSLGIKNDIDAQVKNGLQEGELVAVDPAAAAKVAK